MHVFRPLSLDGTGRVAVFVDEHGGLVCAARVTPDDVIRDVLVLLALSSAAAGGLLASRGARGWVGVWFGLSVAVLAVVGLAFLGGVLVRILVFQRVRDRDQEQAARDAEGAWLLRATTARALVAMSTAGRPVAEWGVAPAVRAERAGWLALELASAAGRPLTLRATSPVGLVVLWRLRRQLRHHPAAIR